jgi:hypothetical protein
LLGPAPVLIGHWPVSSITSDLRIAFALRLATGSCAVKNL